MNIFASFPCPVRSAQILDDSRIIKMPLESCQMMATVAQTLGCWQSLFPRPSHVHHPLTKWVAAGRENFDWLWEHAVAMDLERQLRFNNDHVHITLDACYRGKLHRLSRKLPVGSTPFVNCARNRELGIDFTHLEVHRAYRSYLVARWKTQTKPAICSIKGLLAHGKSWRQLD